MNLKFCYVLMGSVLASAFAFAEEASYSDLKEKLQDSLQKIVSGCLSVQSQTLAGHMKDKLDDWNKNPSGPTADDFRAFQEARLQLYQATRSADDKETIECRSLHESSWDAMNDFFAAAVEKYKPDFTVSKVAAPAKSATVGITKPLTGGIVHRKKVAPPHRRIPLYVVSKKPVAAKASSIQVKTPPPRNFTATEECVKRENQTVEIKFTPADSLTPWKKKIVFGSQATAGGNDSTHVGYTGKRFKDARAKTIYTTPPNNLFRKENDSDPFPLQMNLEVSPGPMGSPGLRSVFQFEEEQGDSTRDYHWGGTAEVRALEPTSHWLSCHTAMSSKENGEDSFEQEDCFRKVTAMIEDLKLFRTKGASNFLSPSKKINQEGLKVLDCALFQLTSFLASQAHKVDSLNAHKMPKNWLKKLPTLIAKYQQEAQAYAKLLEGHKNQEPTKVIENAPMPAESGH